MASYRLDVRPILDEVGGSVHLRDSLDVTELVVGDVTFGMRSAPYFDVTVSNAGEAIVAYGDVTAEVTTTCVRCLKVFDLEITGEVEGLWARPGIATPESDDEPEQVSPEGWIDLEPSLVAALVVEAPFAPIHAEDCEGLCPRCGADLNSGTCRCDAQPDEEHPFAGLKGLLSESSDDDRADSD